MRYTKEIAGGNSKKYLLSADNDILDGVTIDMNGHSIYLPCMVIGEWDRISIKEIESNPIICHSNKTPFEHILGKQRNKRRAKWLKTK